MPQLSTAERPARPRAGKSLLPDFEVSGPAGAPLIVALGGISATKHVVATDSDPSPGWWGAVVGPGRAIDTTQFRVLSIDYLDGGRTPDGRPERTVSTHDQAYAIRRVLDFLGVHKVRAIVGASYGGMVALAFGERYGSRVEQLIVIGAAHEPHPMSTALRSVQRNIVELGLQSGQGYAALALARQLAVTTYRSAQEFANRFESQPSSRSTATAEFPVERYLQHCGQKFAAAWTPERFLSLSLSIDLHQVDPRAVKVPTVLISAEGDLVVPRSQMQQLAQALGPGTELFTIETQFGHDAFLKQTDTLGFILFQTLN